MDVVEKTTALFEALGPHIYAIAVRFRPDARAWSIALGDDAVVNAALDETGERLTFAISLPPPSPEKAAEHHALLLRCNFVAMRSGGFYAALSPEGAPVLMFEQDAGRLDATRAERIVSGLAEARKGWAAIARDPGSTAAAPPSPLGIRV